MRERALRAASLYLLLCFGCNEGVVAEPPPADLDPENRDSMTLRLELFVNDVQVSMDFYTGVLGFESLGGTTDYAPIRAGRVMLGLTPVSSLPGAHHFRPEINDQRRGLGTEVVLEVDDVDNYYAAVRETGYPIETPLTERSWGSTDFRVVDPDGYYLRLTSR